MKSKLFTIVICLVVFSVHSQKSAIPVAGLTDKVTNCVLRYYYFPNIEAYFDTKKSIYLYSEKGKWITAKELPVGYRGYSLYNKINVLIRDYDDEDPTQFFIIHKKRYPYVHNARTRDALISMDDS